MNGIVPTVDWHGSELYHGGIAGVAFRGGVSSVMGGPAALNDRDIAGATHIFAIGCALPDRARASGKTGDWSDVPDVSVGYAASRDAIRRHVEQLLNDLQRRR